MSNAKAIEQQTLEALENSDEGLTIDLSAVEYVDSAGIRAIIEMRRLLTERQQALSMVVPAGSTIRKALYVGGVTAVIPTYDSEDAARAAR